MVSEVASHPDWHQAIRARSYRSCQYGQRERGHAHTARRCQSIKFHVQRQFWGQFYANCGRADRLDERQCRAVHDARGRGHWWPGAGLDRNARDCQWSARGSLSERASASKAGTGREDRRRAGGSRAATGKGKGEARERRRISMIVFQEIVTGNQKYSFSNQPNLTVFDMHNDSPYNMGVSFGNDTGIGNADYYTSPHSILIGIGPTGKGQRSVGGVRWSGTVYLYTQTPMGGGTTNLASAPAQQITVIGYATGYNPTGTTSLNRMNNVANPVNTVGGSANSLQNDNNIAGTVIMEASVSADPSSAVRLTNDAQLTLGTGLDPASVTIITQNGTITIAKTGIVTLPYFLFVDLIQAIAGNDIKIFADALKSFIVTVGSTDT